VKMNLELAKSLINKAISQAENMGIFCSVVVVDDKGFLVAAYRMDSALIPTLDIARDKAWTAAVFRTPSSEVNKYGDPSKANAGFNTQNWNDRLTTIPGGLPVESAGKVIGSMGVSGGDPGEDVQVCRGALEVLE